jgi:hypothetical protein
MKTRFQCLQILRKGLHNDSRIAGGRIWFSTGLVSSSSRPSSTGLVPGKDLDPVGTLGAEDEGRPAGGIETEHLLHGQRQTVMAFEEVDRPGRYEDPPDATRRDHPVAARAAQITRDR